MTRVLVLSGGNSNEREISLRSAENVVEALQVAGFEVSEADPASADFNLETLIKEVDVVLPVLHGGDGEDGTIQSQLEAIGIPYLGSDSVSAALSFDKVKTKEVLAENGILTPSYEVVDRQQFELSDLRRGAHVVKPINGGSSIDILIVHDPETHQVDSAVIDSLFERYEKLLVEELVVGREITVAVLDQEPLPTITIIPPKDEEFDYENKYNGRTQEIPQQVTEGDVIGLRSQEIALAVHRLVGARHISRTDMIINDKDMIYTLEINSLPGLTRESLLPKAAEANGINIVQLVTRFVEMALRDR